VSDEALRLKLRVFENDADSCRQGRYSAWCTLADGSEMLFDIDRFNSKKDAERWAGYYFDYLDELGIEFKII
jgi:hypothetical protein